MLAMLRCTKTSPGCRPRIAVSGQRESEHPIHRICGDCPDASFGKRSGVVEDVRSAQVLLEAKRVLYVSTEARGKEKG